MIQKNGNNWLITPSRILIGRFNEQSKINIDNFRITDYATASTDESVLIIGGYTGGSPSIISTIAEYKNGSWKNIGNLAQARYRHSAITSGPVTIIVGGWPYSGSS